MSPRLSPDRTEQQVHLLQSMVARSPTAIVMLDRRLRIVEASQRWLAAIGSTRSRSIGMTHHDCVPDEPEHWKVAQRRGLAGESVTGGLESFIRADGKEHWYTWQVTPWGDAGETTGGILIWSEELTSRKKFEAAARRRGREYRALFANMPEGLAHCRLISDPEGSFDCTFLSVNKAFVSLTGLRGVKGRKMSEVFARRPRIEPALLELFRRVALTGVPEKLELYLDCLRQWVSTSTYSPEPGSFVVIFDIVTARRQAESAARQWQHAFEQSGIGIALTNIATGTVEVMNAAAERILGYTSDEVAGGPVSVFYSPAEWERRQEAVKRFNSESNHVQLECLLRRKDGSEFAALIDSTSVRDETGKVISNINVLQDLTALKRAEANRREGERMIRALLDSAPQGILAMNQEGRIVFVNRMAGAIFGYTGAELAGRPMESLIPQSAGNPHSAHFSSFFSSPGSRRMGRGMTLHAQRRDNTRFPVEVSLSFIEGTNLAAGGVDPVSPHSARSGGFAVAFISDISERERLETVAREHAQHIQALSASLLTSQEDERRRLSRELHDGLCQQLAFLAIKMGGLIAEPLPDHVTRELRVLQARAARAAETARHLAHQLHPSSLDDLGLVISLQSLCEEFSAENDIPVRFTKRDVPRSVSREIASCFFRIAQESLQNVVQHAGASYVAVDIASSEGVVILAVEDDGEGFDPEKVRGRGSLGLTGMQERARLVNGTLRIFSRPRQGTRVEIEIPVPREPQ